VKKGKMEVTIADYKAAIDQIRLILWPQGNQEHEWSPDTIEAIARVVSHFPASEERK
jgi:hypothetical protein